jgi:hypothetical protein
MAIIIPIVSEFAGKGVQRAIKEFQSLQGVTDKAAFLLKKAMIPAALATGTATVALGTALIKAANNAAEDQRSQALLARQLQNTTNATNQQIAAVDDYISRLQLATGVADDQLRPALGALVRATGEVDAAQQQLALALDISAATGRDLDSVSTALGRAYLGNFTALTRLGIPLDDNIKKSKDYGAIQKLLNEQFGGAAATAADTYQGRLQRLKVGLDEIKETVGYAVLPFLQRLVNYINRAIVPAVLEFVEGLTGGKGLKASFVDALAAGGKFGEGIIDAMEKAALSVLIFANRMALAYEYLQAIATIIFLLKGNIPAAFTAATKAVAAYGAVLATDVAFDKTKQKFDDLRNAVEESAASQRRATATARAAGDAVDRIGYQAIATKGSLDDLKTETDGAGASFDKAAERAKKLEERAKDLADTLRQQMSDAMDAARKKVDEARAAFDEMYKATRDAALGALDLDAAFTNAGDNVASGFIDELQEQADRTTLFSSKVRQLLDAGLSESALRRVIAAGVDRGTEIADAILGGAQSVLQVNALVDTIERVADELGMSTAAKFYQAGIDAAQSYLAGIEATVGTVTGLLGRAKTPADVKGASALFSSGMAGAGRNGGGGNYNQYTIYAQSIEPGAAGQAVVDALKEYERRSGYIDITVAGAFGVVD